ncbi:unnamed protein product, partial [Ixodes persulcatus]
FFFFSFALAVCFISNSRFIFRLQGISSPSYDYQLGGRHQAVRSAIRTNVFIVN